MHILMKQFHFDSIFQYLQDIGKTVYRKKWITLEHNFIMIAQGNVRMGKMR